MLSTYFSPLAARSWRAVHDWSEQLSALYALLSSCVQVSGGSCRTCCLNHSLASPPSRPGSSTAKALSASPGYLSCFVRSALLAASPGFRAARAASVSVPAPGCRTVTSIHRRSLVAVYSMSSTARSKGSSPAFGRRRGLSQAGTLCSSSGSWLVQRFRRPPAVFAYQACRTMMPPPHWHMVL